MRIILIFFSFSFLTLVFHNYTCPKIHSFKESCWTHTVVIRVTTSVVVHVAVVRVQIPGVSRIRRTRNNGLKDPVF